MKLNLSIKEITLVGMCAALMAIFSQLSIPLPFTSVPVTLQIFGLVVLAVIVGCKIGTLSIIVFVILGAIGLPVFANFSGGFGVIVGPTGGYIIGFIIMAFLIGYASSKQNKIWLFIASYIGVTIDLLLGTLYLKVVTGMSLQSALIAGLYPFIIKDFVTVAIAVLIGLKVKKNVQIYLQEMLLLRPHHINCIFFYRGLGYSKDFIEGMNGILTLFKENPNTKIKLIVKCDDLCVNCPNKQLYGVCITKEKVARLDYNTLQLYNLEENEEYTFNEIIDTIYKHFNPYKFHEICNTCNWYKEGVCSDNIIEDQLKKWNKCMYGS